MTAAMIEEIAATIDGMIEGIAVMIDGMIEGIAVMIDAMIDVTARNGITMQIAHAPLER